MFKKTSKKTILMIFSTLLIVLLLAGTAMAAQASGGSAISPFRAAAAWLTPFYEGNHPQTTYEVLVEEALEIEDLRVEDLLINELPVIEDVEVNQPLFVVEVSSEPEEDSISFGVVSDTHVTASKTAEQNRLRKVFDFFSKEADLMVIVGDETDNGTVAEWNTFTNIKNEALTIPLLASMGNHEFNLWQNFETATGCKANDVNIINGYYFITVSPGSGAVDRETGRATGNGTQTYAYVVDWLLEKVAEAEAADPTKPIFVFHHHVPLGTYYRTVASYDEAIGLTGVLKGHPRVVSFSGHMHTPNNLTTSLWQAEGGYTAINTATTSYVALESGTLWGANPPDRADFAQGMLVNVAGNKVEIKNYDFYADRWINQTWTFDTTEPFPYTTEKRLAAAKMPLFADSAKLRVESITDTTVTVNFDQAYIPQDDPTGNIVRLYRYDFINLATGNTQVTFLNPSHFHVTPMPATLTITNTGAARALTKGANYELRIYAVDTFDQVSTNYLSTKFTAGGTAFFEAENLTLQPGSNTRNINFAWYSDRDNNTAAVVQIAKKATVTDGVFPADAIIIEGTVGDASAGKSWHKVSVTGLDYNTEYVYQVSNDKNIFSVVYEFKTGPAGDFTFIAVGDIQVTTGNQDTDSIWPWPITTTKAGWATTVSKFATQFAHAAFIMSCGDQVDASGGNETEYANLFAPAELRGIPLAPAMGNHDRHNNFDWHYNLPNITPNGAGAIMSGVDVFGNYWFRANDALIVVLNTSASPNATTVGNYIAQFDATLKIATEANADAKWLFVQHHKSTAAPASHQNDSDVRVWTPVFNALMDKYNVDFVLAGHDHVYSRSWFIKDGAKVENIDYSKNTVTNPDGTLYLTLNSSSGLKYYDFPNNNTSGNPVWVYDITGLYYEGRNNITFTGKPWYTNVGIQVKVPQFSTVDVAADSVTFKTYRTDTMAVIDEYTIIKKTPEIKNVSLQIGADPTQRNFVWYSDATTQGYVQVALKSAMAGSEFPANYSQFDATSSTVGVPQGFSSFKSTATGLAANSAYVYRVGNGSTWSDIYSFNTQSFDGSFSFLTGGDPQVGYRNLTLETAQWTESLEKSLSTFSNASFLVTLGDQVANEFNEAHYDALLSPAVLKTIPLAVVAGNHDVPSPLYAPHFNMPNMSALGNTSANSGDGNYWYVYNNTLFMSLNLVNTDVEQHKQFMMETIAANPDVKWTVLTVHFTLLFEQATNSGYWNITRPLRNALVPIISELGIDIVLAGHDHSYVRTHTMNGLTPVLPANGNISSYTNLPKEQVIYVNTNSITGNIFVALSNTEQPFTAVKNQENVANITNVDITDTSMTVTTYRLTDMSVVDAFTLYKKPVYNFNVSLETKKDAYKVGETFEVDVMLKGDINYTQVAAQISFDSKVLQYESYTYSNGWVASVNQVNSDNVVVRNMASSNMITGIPCTDTIRVATLKFTVKDGFDTESFLTNLNFASLIVTPASTVKTFSTAPGEALNLNLEKIIYTIINPYANVNWSSNGQYKANFHAHSTNSDGANTTAQMVEDHYTKGFDILAMTDHDVLTRNYANVARSDNAYNNNTSDGIGLVTSARVAEIAAGTDRGGRGMIGIDFTNEHSRTEHVNGFWADLLIASGSIGSGRATMSKHHCVCHIH